MSKIHVDLPHPRAYNLPENKTDVFFSPSSMTGGWKINTVEKLISKELIKTVDKNIFASLAGELIVRGRHCLLCESTPEETPQPRYSLLSDLQLSEF